MPGLRVVLDTNVLVSGVTYKEGTSGRIVRLFQRRGLEVVLSRYILDEMVRVLPRMSRNPLSTEHIRDLADSFVMLAELVEPDVSPDANLRDPADQPVLATLRASGADYLITGDKDLLALASEYPIATPAAFWAKHG